jgi:hypothetical protein
MVFSQRYGKIKSSVPDDKVLYLGNGLTNNKKDVQMELKRVADPLPQPTDGREIP